MILFKSYHNFFFKLQSTAENLTSLNLSKRRDSRDNNNDNMDPVYDSENLNPEDVHKSLRYVLLFLVLMYCSPHGFTAEFRILTNFSTNQSARVLFFF